MDVQKIKDLLIEVEILEDKVLVKNNFHKTIEFIANEFGYKMLKDITAVDLQNGNIELNYRMYSIEDGEEVILTYITNSEVDSVTDIFSSAIADENEIYDLFGIHFIGNTTLKRLYMPESWDGYPLRKDYIESDTRLAWNDNNDA